MLARIVDWLATARTRRELGRLSPRLREDIGLADDSVIRREPVGMVHALAPDLLRVLRDPAPLPKSRTPSLPPAHPARLRLAARQA